MQENESLRKWIAGHKLKAELLEQDQIVKMSLGTFLLVQPKQEGKIFGEEMSLLLSEQEVALLNKYRADYFLMKFGSRYYYFDDSNIKMKNVLDSKGEIKEVTYYVNGWRDFKYIGEPNIDFPIKMSYLGIHGPFDLCNGSRSYEDWCKKAEWLGIENIGICEDNTLAGSLDFQKACEKAEIKSIIGETISVKPPKGVDYQIKLYCMNEEGWRNLLWINAVVNTSLEKNIFEKKLFARSKGLICVLTPTSDISRIHKVYDGKFEHLYHQVDLSEWASDMKDSSWLDNYTLYFDKYVDKIEPILIYDSYYLDKNDGEIQRLLWKIGKREFGNQSTDKYFKTVDDIFEQAVPMFSTDKGNDVLLKALENTNVVADLVDFKIPIGEKHLPEYELTEEEQAQYGTAENLFWALIERGLEEKVLSKGLDLDPYMDRIAEEVRVINLGHLRDYFLIVWDILNWARARGILVGLGRGSSAGCMVSYLLGIVQVDPLEYGLLFERFLDEHRVGKRVEKEIVRINSDIELDVEETVLALRDGKAKEISAGDLSVGDQIISTSRRVF